MCVVVLVFCLSLQSRQEPPECMLLIPAPWPSIHRSVDLKPLTSVFVIILSLLKRFNSGVRRFKTDLIYSNNQSLV